MTFNQIQKDLKLYLGVSGPEAIHLLKSFINEAVIDFARMWDWKFLQKVETLTLDGSDSYDLSTVLSEYFYREMSLIIPYGNQIQLSSNDTNTQETLKTKFTKYNYDTYEQLSSKDYAWSVLGNTLYVTGESGDLKFMYISLGVNYPLSDDSDEINALTYYSDVIKKFTIVKYLEYIGDIESVTREEGLLQRALMGLKSNEKRGFHAGKFKHIRR